MILFGSPLPTALGIKIERGYLKSPDCLRLVLKSRSCLRGPLHANQTGVHLDPLNKGCSAPQGKVRSCQKTLKMEIATSGARGATGVNAPRIEPTMDKFFPGLRYLLPRVIRDQRLTVAVAPNLLWCASIPKPFRELISKTPPPGPNLLSKDPSRWAKAHIARLAKEEHQHCLTWKVASGGLTVKTSLTTFTGITNLHKKVQTG